MIITPISEVCDRYCIIKLKIEKAVDCSDELIATFYKEKELLESEINRFERDGAQSMGGYVEKLYKINKEIWELESDVRKGKEQELGLEEVGRRALLIRDLNRERILIKNEIVQLTKEGFFEVKINHSSQ